MLRFEVEEASQWGWFFSGFRQSGAVRREQFAAVVREK
jgi:hypothetical protein